MRGKLLEELLQCIDREFEAEEMGLQGDCTLDLDDFEFNVDEQDEEFESSPFLPDAPKITNQTFQRMFRSTAAILHPDREQDSTLREEKQSLMVELLSARKKGDVMTILALYQAHVGGEETFSKTDEKQLIAALEHQIHELENEREQFAQQSPLHWMAYERFYYPSKRKVDKAIVDHLTQVRHDKLEIERMVKEINSLKALKPWLKQRYDEGHMMLPGLAEMFGEVDFYK